MADNGNEELHRDQATNVEDAASHTDPADSANAERSSKAESAPTQWPAIEEQLSGAVRQAVTDVLKAGQQQPGLPAIDMDFVAGNKGAQGNDPSRGKVTVNRGSSALSNPESIANAVSSHSRLQAARTSTASEYAAPRSAGSRPVLIGAIALAVVAAGAAAVVFGPMMTDAGTPSIRTTRASTTAMPDTASLTTPTHQTPDAETGNTSELSGPSANPRNKNVDRRFALQQQEVTDLKAAVEKERILLEAKLKANREALAQAQKQATQQRRAAAARNTATVAERQLLEAQLAAKRASLAEAESRAALQQQEAAEQKAATQADRLLLEAKRAAVEEAERRIALQRETAAQQRVVAEAEQQLLEAKRATMEAAAQRLARQRQEVTRQRLAVESRQKRERQTTGPGRQPAAELAPSATTTNPSGQRPLTVSRAAQEKVDKYRAAETTAIERLREASARTRDTPASSTAAGIALLPTIRSTAETVPTEPLATTNQPIDGASALRKQQLQPGPSVSISALHKDSLPARERATNSSPDDLPDDWAEEEKVRLRLEQLLIAAANEASAPQLRNGPILARRAVTLQLKNSNLKIAGELKSHSQKFYVILLPSQEEISLPVEYFDCNGNSCPKPPNEPSP